MDKKRNIATWLGVILGTVMALALNATLAHASEDVAVVKEEFHQTYPLAANGRVHTLERFKIDEAAHAVLACKSWNQALAMLKDAPANVIGDANVESTISFARQNVDEVVLRRSRACHLGGPH